MIRHSSKVKVDDLQGLLLVTSVVASATNKREELSEESQVNFKSMNLEGRRCLTKQRSKPFLVSDL